MTSRGISNNGAMAEPLKPSDIDFGEMGVIDQLPFSGGFGKNELIDVRDITLDQITEMRRRDGQIRAVFRVLSLPIRTAPMNVTPTEGEGNADGEEEAEFVTDALTKPPMQGGMTSSFRRTLAHMTLALAEGFACFEKVWHVAPDNRLTYRKLAPRASSTIKFLLDESGGLEGVKQRVTWQGKRKDVTIPAEKLLIYTAQHEENPWYGESYLLPAYYHYEVKHKLYYIAHLAHQFHAVPGRVGTYPQAAPKGDRDAFQRSIASFGFNTAMMKPAGWDLDDFGGDGQMPDFEKMLNHHDAAIAKSVLAHFIQLGTGTAQGSWALSRDQSEFFTMALEAILDEMSEILYFYLVPQLVDYNFNSRAYPEIRLGPLADSTQDILKEVFTEISDAASMNVSREFMFEVEAKVAEELGLEIDYEQMREQLAIEAEQERAIAVATQEALLERSRRPQEEPDGGAGAPGAEEEPPAREGAVAASEVIELADAIKARLDKGAS